MSRRGTGGGRPEAWMAIDEHPISPRTGAISPRDYLAGTGAAGSLLAAAFVALVSVTAFIAFDEVPFGGDGDGAGTISLGGTGSNAVSEGIGGVGPAGAIALGPGPAAAGGGGAGAPGAPGAAGAGDPGDPDGPAAPTGGGLPPAPGASPGPSPSGAPNPIDQAVSGLDGTAEGAIGVDPNLGGAANPVTGAVDQAAQGLTGNDVGGHLEKVTGPP